MSESTIYYRRNLPHIHPSEGKFFITFRLAGTIPENVLILLKEEKAAQIKLLIKKFNSKQSYEEHYKIEKRFFAKYDAWLDKCSYGPQWLKDVAIARIVVTKLHDLDGKRYTLIAYCIMYNHVHLLIDLTGFFDLSITNILGKSRKSPLADCLRLLKGSTSRSANLHLARQGSFWHHESYDHYLRSEEEYARVIEYILNNPVKAGLVENWQEWPFNYLANK